MLPCALSHFPGPARPTPQPGLSSEGFRINLQTVALPRPSSPGAAPSRGPHWGVRGTGPERCFYWNLEEEAQAWPNQPQKPEQAKKNPAPPDQRTFLWVLGVFCSTDSLVFAVSHKHTSVIHTVNLLHLKFTVNDLFPRIQETE